VPDTPADVIVVATVIPVVAVPVFVAAKLTVPPEFNELEAVAPALTV
jgi:hypothetical protein